MCSGFLNYTYTFTFTRINILFLFLLTYLITIYGYRKYRNMDIPLLSAETLPCPPDKLTDIYCRFENHFVRSSKFLDRTLKLLEYQHFFILYLKILV